MGEMVIEVPNGMDPSKMRLTEVLYSPEIGFTLVSIGHIDDAGCYTTFGGGKCEIRSGDGKILGTIPKTKGLYRIVHESTSPQANVAEPAPEKLTVMDLHRRMGHIAPSAAKRLVTHGFVTGIELDLSSDDPTFCESCVYAKTKRQPVPKVREGDPPTKYGEVIHSDLWVPSPIMSLGGKNYFVTFTDGSSRDTHLYLLRKKDETFAAYKNFETWARVHMDSLIHALNSDRGGEYLSEEFIKHLDEQGTKRKLTVHDTPEQNGVSERLNGILLEKVRAMLHASGLPKFLWAEAVRHAVWLKNRTSTKALMVVPRMRLSMGRSLTYLVYVSGVVVYGYMITRVQSWMEGRRKDVGWVLMGKVRGIGFTGWRRGLLRLREVWYRDHQEVG